MDRKTSIANGLAHENVGATSLFTPLDVAAAYTQDFVSQKNKYESWDQFIVTWRRILKKKKVNHFTLPTLKRGCLEVGRNHFGVRKRHFCCILQLLSAPLWQFCCIPKAVVLASNVSSRSPLHCAAKSACCFNNRTYHPGPSVVAKEPATQATPLMFNK